MLTFKAGAACQGLRQRIACGRPPARVRRLYGAGHRSSPSSYAGGRFPWPSRPLHRRAIPSNAELLINNTSLTSAPVRTRMVKCSGRCGLELGGLGSWHSTASSSSSLQSTCGSVPPRPGLVLLGAIAAAGCAQHSSEVIGTLLGHFVVIGAPQDQVDRAQLAGQGDNLGLVGVTNSETVLPPGTTSYPGPLGSADSVDRDVVHGKYANILQDGLAEGLADAQAGSARM